MALPKAIQQQIEEADRIETELHGPGPGAQPDTQPQEVPTEQQPVQQPEVAVPEVEPVAQSVPEETWERKFHSLQGKYDAEVPRLHATIRELTQNVNSLVARMQQVEAQPTAQPQEQKVPLITDSDREAFGSDLVDLIERATKQVAAEAQARERQLLAEIEQLKGTVGTVNEQVGDHARDRYFEKLTGKVADWEALNNDPAFIGWLDEVDPVYGVPRRAGLDTAFKSYDADRTAAIFDAYKRLVAPPQPTKPQPSLQSQVAPTRSRASQAPAATENTKIWTGRDIDVFYENWRRGYIDEQEAMRIEAEIHAATAEGRVRP